MEKDQLSLLILSFLLPFLFKTLVVHVTYSISLLQDPYLLMDLHIIREKSLFTASNNLYKNYIITSYK